MKIQHTWTPTPALPRALPPLIKTSEYTLQRAFGSFDRWVRVRDEATYVAADALRTKPVVADLDEARQRAGGQQI